MIKKFGINKKIIAAKSVEVILEKIIIPELLKNPDILYSSKKIEKMDLLFRELFGLIIVCCVGHYISGVSCTFIRSRRSRWKYYWIR